LLASQWTKLNELELITNKHKDFAKFVLHHIDASASDDELKKIAQYADTECPQHADQFCAKIGAQAKAAAFESDKADQDNTP
jgi:hypothetical protein